MITGVTPVVGTSDAVKQRNKMFTLQCDYDSKNAFGCWPKCEHARKKKKMKKMCNTGAVLGGGATLTPSLDPPVAPPKGSLHQ